MAELRPKYIDIHPQYDQTGYKVTNETVTIFDKLLEGRKRFGKVGCIASGGEVWLASLLPRAKELFAVDHSYAALLCSYGKAVLLSQLGPSGFRELLKTKTHQEFDALLKSVAPEELRTKIKIGYGWTVGDHDEALRVWATIPDEALAASAKKIDKVTLIHGDLSDIEKYGPFDVAYVSNAFEHTGRDGYEKRPSLNNLPPLKNRAIVLSTHAKAPMTPITQEWDLCGKHDLGQWSHVLYRRKRVKKAAVLPEVAGAILTDQQGVTNAAHV